MSANRDGIAMKILATLVVVLSLTLLIGCAQRRLESDIKELKDVCQHRYNTGVYATEFERVQCVNQGFIEKHQEYGYPHTDLIILLNSYRLALAQRVDEGTVSKSEAQLSEAKVAAIIEREERRRYNQKTAAQVESSAAMTDMLQRINTSTQPRPLAPAPMNHRITCRKSGEIISCW